MPAVNPMLEMLPPEMGDGVQCCDPVHTKGKDKRGMKLEATGFDAVAHCHTYRWLTAGSGLSACVAAMWPDE